MEEALRSKPSLVKTLIAKAWKNTTCSAAKNRSEVNSGKRGLAVSMFTDEGPPERCTSCQEYIRCAARRQSILKRGHPCLVSKARWRFQPSEVGIPASTHARHPPSIDSTFV